jgi:hypothetical protein
VGGAVRLIAEENNVVGRQEENYPEKIYCEEEDIGEVAQEGEGSG